MASQHSGSTAGCRVGGERERGKTKSNLGQTKVCLAQRSFWQYPKVEARGRGQGLGKLSLHFPQGLAHPPTVHCSGTA